MKGPREIFSPVGLRRSADRAESEGHDAKANAVEIRDPADDPSRPRPDPDAAKMVAPLSHRLNPICARLATQDASLPARAAVASQLGTWRHGRRRAALLD
jgi:hypothetical protein